MPGSGRRRATSDLPLGQLRLLLDVATAANEATSVAMLVPRLLELLCTELGWSGGALVRWSGGPAAAAPSVVHQHGAFLVDAAACLSTVPPGLSVAGGVVTVPLSVPGEDPTALVLVCGGAVPDEHQRGVLELVAGEVVRVAERESLTRQLQTNTDRFRSVFDLSPLPMALTLGSSGTYAMVNEAFCRLLGRTRSELAGTSARAVVHPDDHPLVEPAGAAAYHAPDGRYQQEMRLVHADGTVVTALVTLAWIDGPGSTRNLLTQIEDITARRKVEELLRRQAERDSLTGLANRSRLTRFLTRLGSSRTRCLTFFIDVDGFKTINDSHGHAAGDRVLVDVGRRLTEVVGAGDLVARFGGDEFVVVCPVSDAETALAAHARSVAARIRRALERPVHTPIGPARVTVSVGVAGGTADPERPEELVQQADAAMYHAKVLGKDRCEVYDAELHERTLEHQHTDALLRHALDEDRFVVHYQPIVDLADGSTVGVEALVRLVDRDGHLVPPARFIPAAERNGLVVPMGAWVLREGCRTIARIREATGRPLTLSVNVAARQAARPDLSETVLAALTECGLPEEALTLELTESALLEADGATLRQLVGLRERGVRVGLDDFGTGYSSLTYLRTFPVSHLKVDRSFVQGMVTSEGDRAIVRAVTRLADDLGLEWIAEGIEGPEHHAAVAALGGGFGQGYLFGRPVPEAELLAMLQGTKH